MALGTLILNAFSVRTAPGRLIRCRCSAIQNNLQANTYGLDGPERHRRFYLAVLIGSDDSIRVMGFSAARVVGGPQCARDRGSCRASRRRLLRIAR
jgi:hypothetical protein